MDALRMAAGGLLVALLGDAAVSLVAGLRRLRGQEERRRLARARLEAELAAIEAARRNREEAPASWRGWRKFEVKEKVGEASGVASIHLVPHDGRPLPPFQPGQFLTFRLFLPGQPKPIVRCYSLSDAAHPDRYRITVKRCLGTEGAPPGLASCWMVDSVRPGDLLDVQAPAGNFTLDLQADAPVVLVAGGIGVTPLLAMLEALAARGSKREVWFFYGVRNSGEHALRAALEKAAAAHSNVFLQVAYSNPLPSDREGSDFHHRGRVSVDLFRRVLPSSNYDFYVCGPPPLMESVVRGLKEWGVPDERVHSEAFGPASVKKVAPPPAAAATALRLTFARSGKEAAWTAGSILEAAAAAGVKIESGCLAGSCQSCITAVKSGEVGYLSRPGSPPESGSCLTCIAVPKTDLVLDA